MKFCIQRGLRIGLCIFASLSFFVGCAQVEKLREHLPSFKKGPEPSKETPYYEHTVKWSGESLSVIAKWYTGSMENWRALAKANPEIKPSRIYIGQKIRIPENLLRTKEPMPKGFLVSPRTLGHGETPSGTPKPEPGRVKERPTAPPRGPGYYEHKVRWSGESLSVIAKWYTGSMENWRALAKANPEIKPSRIYIGQKIRIPDNLLRTREPMPKSFLSGTGSKSKEKPASSAPASTQPSQGEEPQLFGPKPYPKK